jgi:outer membrane protein, heavy metal efflux system
MRWLLALFVCQSVLAVESLTLPGAVAQAVAHNPELRAARAQIEAATGRAAQSRLWPNPELELAAEDVPADGGGLAQSKNMIGLAQTVPFPGKKSLDGQIGRRHERLRQIE